MRALILGTALIFGSSAVADVAVAPAMGPYVVYHEAEMDENNCHTAKRKRHNFHCHEVEVSDEVDVTEAPSETGDVLVASD